KIATLEDANLLLEINNAAVPDVNRLTDAKAQWLAERVVTPGLALLDDQPAGVVVVLSDQCGYDSDYYRWFTERYQNFLYIDRVIVAASARGRGVASALYGEIDRIAQERKLAIVADVYSDPPNVPSLAFHHAMGFQEVGSQDFPALGKTAAKLMKYVECARKL
ncbi:MAG: GNAT family N-acetyltransferase, partial [Chloroflexota bacterium]